MPAITPQPFRIDVEYFDAEFKAIWLSPSTSTTQQYLYYGIEYNRDGGKIVNRILCVSDSLTDILGPRSILRWMIETMLDAIANPIGCDPPLSCLELAELIEYLQFASKPFRFEIRLHVTLKIITI